MADENSIHFVEAEIVWPTSQQAQDGLLKLAECMPSWTASHALYIEKPKLGLIVSLECVEHDDRGFTITLGVKEALVAPADFDKKTFTIGCVWNQPYLDFDARGLHAPYCFSLYFGATAVAGARQRAESFPDLKKREPSLFLLPLLRP